MRKSIKALMDWHKILQIEHTLDLKLAISREFGHLMTVLWNFLMKKLFKEPCLAIGLASPFMLVNSYEDVAFLISDITDSLPSGSTWFYIVGRLDQISVREQTGQFWGKNFHNDTFVWSNLTSYQGNHFFFHIYCLFLHFLPQEKAFKAHLHRASALTL